MRQATSDSERALRTLSWIVAIGLVSVVLYAIQAGSLRQFAAIAGTGVVLAGASLLVGGLLGFLFGIPRTLQGEPPAGGAEGDEAAGEEWEGQGVSYLVNTNLEDISDWLTKILVGVGLTQLSSIPEGLRLIGDYVAAGIGNPTGGRVYAIGTLTYFLVCGFLFGYLWTRLYLAGALRRADLTALGMLRTQVAEVSRRAEQADRKMEALSQQAEIDARALSLVYRTLDPSVEAEPIDQGELNEAIREASPSVQIQILEKAHDVRSANWRDEATKPVMERTIPIFHALVEGDRGERSHRYHAQLGYALKDQRVPDWAAAEAALSRAIELRGPWEEGGFLMYEYNRALCRIAQDEGYQQGKASSPEARVRILADLEAVAAGAGVQLLAQRPSSEIERWLALNKLDLDDLG